jgi:hypothetical protein
MAPTLGRICANFPWRSGVHALAKVASPLGPKRNNQGRPHVLQGGILPDCSKTLFRLSGEIALRVDQASNAFRRLEMPQEWSIFMGMLLALA